MVLPKAQLPVDKEHFKFPTGKKKSVEYSIAEQNSIAVGPRGWLAGGGKAYPSSQTLLQLYSLHCCVVLYLAAMV